MPKTVHVLHHALPLCGFTRKEPARWPEGHVWIPKEEVEVQKQWIRAERSQGVLCEDCETVLMGRPLPAHWDMQEQQLRDMMTTAARNLLERLGERGLNDITLIVEDLRQTLDMLHGHILNKEKAEKEDEQGDI